MTAFHALALAAALNAAGAAVDAAKFAAAEERHLSAAAANDAAALYVLAQFYAANRLWDEALAALRRSPADDERSARLAAECDYRMGRNRRVVARLKATLPKHPLHAMALARLGAYAEARKWFAQADLRALPPELLDDFRLLQAESQIETGDAAAADAVLAGVQSRTESAARLYLIGRAHAARGATDRAVAAYNWAARTGADAWTHRARLAGALAEGEATESLERLSLDWRGGAFERELNLALGRRRLADGDLKGGLRMLGLVLAHHADSDAALVAEEAIAAVLPGLLAAGSPLDPKGAAQLFFEYVEFAPAGREGDALIRTAAEKLSALGLYRQAAQLLDHQAFKRLRGRERSLVAIELAELHLRAGAPGDALAALRATRLAGLEEDANARRRRIEAKALAALGRTEEALALLSAAAAAGDLLLRAEVNWSRRAWAAAAVDYASYFAATERLDSRADREAAVRAAAAFLLSGDRAGYRAFAKEALLRLEGAPEGDLIAALGDVDRERFLARFMAAYRSAYGGNGP
jgi:hypothetical protein